MYPSVNETTTASRTCGESILTEAAIVTGKFACRAGSVKLGLTDATNVVFGQVPSPCGYAVPLLNLDLHTATRVGDR